MTYLKWLFLLSAAVTFFAVVHAALAAPSSGGGSEVGVDILGPKARPPLDVREPAQVRTATFALG